MGVHLSLGRHGTLQGRGGDNTLQGYVTNARGNRGEQASELGPGANRLDVTQGALQHSGTQQHHNRRLGGAHSAVHGQRVGNHGARQRGTEPAQRHEGSAQALSGRSLLQGGEVLRIQIVVGAFGGVRHTVGA